MISTKNISTRGFTIIELLLSLTFVAFILLFITSAIIQTTRLYSKGTTMRQINQVGRQLSDELYRNMRYQRPVINMGTKRLCTGTYSYAWNTLDLSSRTLTDTNKFTLASATEPISLIRGQDTAKAWCSSSADIDKNDTVQELLGGNVALQAGEVVPMQAGAVTKIRFVLSTTGDNSPSAGMAGAPAFCPEGIQGAFCAMGEFNLSVYSRNGAP